eukprot:g33612.t1
MAKFKEGYYANSSRKARASIRKTVEKILENLGLKGKEDCWSRNAMEQVGMVLKDSDYRAGVAYLAEYKHMLIEAGVQWSHLLQKTFGQVVRALNRAKGPAKKAAEVDETKWLEACRVETNDMAKGIVHKPALMFAVATVWMLREVELAAIHKEDILIDEKEKLVALTLRLTKTDQEGKGLRRTLQCCCREERGWKEAQNAMLQPTLQKEQVREIKTLDETKVKEITKEMESRLKGEAQFIATDEVASFLKLQVAWVKKAFHLNVRARDLKSAGGMQPYPTHKLGLIPFTFYCAIYVIFVSAVLWVPEGHDVIESLTSALQRPTLGPKGNPLSREINYDLDFDRIETREDVLRWLAVSLPKALYNSSESGNVLSNYPAAPEYKQVVINDWNILMGQTPVRLSLSYDHLSQVSNNSVTSRLPVPQLVRQPDSPDSPVTTKEGLKDQRAQQVLHRYCGNYSVEEKGFSCMLSVDPAVTIPALLEMRLNGIATNQTREVKLDFVAYNGFLDMFFYVAIVFDFTTSGYIDKAINVNPIKLPDLSSSFFPIRLILEIVIILFTVGRLSKCMRAIYRVALAGINKGNKGQAKAFGHRLIVVIQVLVYHILQQPSILFDFLSGITTIVTLVMWYSFVLLDLSQSFYFAETPNWTPAQCALTGICSDAAAISKFARASQQMKFFTQVCAANTIFLFLGYQKYLSAFPTGRIIAKAMLSGFADILCFFVVMVVLLMGYVSMGHTIFGTLMIDFSTLGYSLITCFQMFLGTFRSFAAMRQANSFAYYFYWYTYMVLFRYVLVNMFFAIVAKHFQREDNEYKEQSEQSEQRQESQEASRLSLMAAAKLAAKSLVGVWSYKDGTEKLEEETDAGIESLAGEDLEVLSTPKSGRGVDTPMSTDSPLLDDSFITADLVVEPNWKFLPDETRQWAVDKAKEIFRFIQQNSRLREEERRENVAAMKKAQTGFCDQFFLFNLVPLLQVAALQLCPRLAYLNECDGSLGEPRCSQNHDREAFAETKLPNIADECPVLEALGVCPAGLNCRFSGHVLDGKNVDKCGVALPPPEAAVNRSRDGEG